jgi:hypothetical protein
MYVRRAEMAISPHIWGLTAISGPGKRMSWLWSNAYGR